MRPNNPNKRLRGRNRSKNTNPLARSYESNGPDVKIRGSALQVAEKYAQLARDAQSSSDRVMAENYFQHAEHYYRIVAEAYEQQNRDNPQRSDRREGERGPRQDVRQRGSEQPMIGGYDGVDDYDDGGLRRTVRANGGDSDEHGEDGYDGDGRNGTGNGSLGHDEPNGRGNGHAQSMDAGEATDEAPSQEPEAATEASGEDAKPKRKRAPRSRTRRPRAEADGDSAPAEANEQ